MTNMKTIDAMNAWHDNQTHQNLTRLVNALETEANPAQAHTDTIETYS